MRKIPVVVATVLTLVVGAVALYAEDQAVQGMVTKDQSRLLFDPELPTDVVAPRADHVILFSPEDAVWWSSGIPVSKKGDLLDIGARKNAPVVEVLPQPNQKVAVVP